MNACESISLSINLYIHLPILFVSLVVAFFVLSADRKSKINRSLFVFVLIFCFWILNDMLQYMIFEKQALLFFSRLALIQTMSLFFFLVFSYEYAEKGLNIKRKLLFFLPFLPVIAFIFTDYNATLDENCDINFGSLYWYVYFLIFLYSAWSMKILFRYRKENKDNEKIKRQLNLIAKGFILFILWFVISIAATYYSVQNNYSWGDTIFIFTPVSMLLFIIFVAYSVVKYQFLNIKLMAVQVLVVVLVVLIGSQLFFIQNPVNRALTGMTLVLAIGFGYMLIRSVRSEVQRREELQVMSDRLAQANDQLRKLDNAKSEFISIASHQLRTPLTAIKGFISLLLEGSYGKMTPNFKDVLNKVYLSNERLIALVEDMLNLSRIESGRMEYNFEKVKMEDVAKEVYDTFVIRSKEKGLKLELKLPEKTLPEAMTDRNKIREVVSNLVDNAIKYTLKGWVVLKLSESNDKILISVIDTGIGIPEEEIPYLFNKFSRGKDISRLNTGGTGLGLHVGKRMVDALHGHLWVESEGAGKGSTFNVEIPIEMKEEK